MTIYFSFINIPHGSERCDVRLGPSLPDHDFLFNLGAHKPGDATWRLAAAEPVSGAEVHDLALGLNREDDLFLIVKNIEGREERLRYHLTDMWLYDGHVVSTQIIADYKRLFPHHA